MEQSNWNPNDPEFAITDKTILKDYLEIDKIEGVITENYLTNAVSNGVDKDDDDVKVEVSRLNDEAEDGTKTIAEGETNASDYLGYTVVAYVTDLEESDPTFLAVTPKAGYNQTLKVDLANFDSATEGSKSVSVKYWKDRDADKKVSTLYTNAEDVLTITNNRSESLDGADVAALFGDKGYNAETTKDGNIVFIDNNKDDKYDAMIITEFGANYVVKTIDAAKNKITAESGSSLTLDVESEDQYVTIVKDGKTIEFDDIETGDVITLVSDATTVKNAKVVTAYVSSNRIDGKITGATRDGYYKIDGKSYKAANTLSDSDLKVGTTGTFYLNVNDKIVYVGDSATAGSGTYGYLYAAGKENTFSSGGKDVILFEMLTQEGKWTRYELDSKVRFIQEDKNIDERIDDTNPTADLIKYMPNVFKDAAAVANDTFKLTADAESYKDRVIKFDQKDGVITRIYLPTANGDEFGYEDETDTEYREDGTYFKGGSALDENTTIFAFSGDYSDKKSVTVTSASIFKDGENYSYRGFEDDGDAYKAVVAKVAEDYVTVDNRFIVVSDIILTSNEDDDEVYEIQGFQGADGEVDDAFSIMTNTNWDDADFIESNSFGVTDVSDLMPGDVIIVNTDASGDVSKIKVLMTADAALLDGETKTFYEVDNSNENKPVVDAFGYVYKKVSNRISLALEVEIDDEDNVKGIAPDEDMEFTIGGSKFKGSIYLVDMTTSKTRISISDIGEIEPNNATTSNGKNNPAYMTYVRTVDGTVTDVVVYAVDGALMENIAKTTPSTTATATAPATEDPEVTE